MRGRGDVAARLNAREADLLDGNPEKLTDGQRRSCGSEPTGNA